MGKQVRNSAWPNFILYGMSALIAILSWLWYYVLFAVNQFVDLFIWLHVHLISFKSTINVSLLHNVDYKFHAITILSRFTCNSKIICIESQCSDSYWGVTALIVICGSIGAPPRPLPPWQPRQSPHHRPQDRQTMGKHDKQSSQTFCYSFFTD